MRVRRFRASDLDDVRKCCVGVFEGNDYLPRDALDLHGNNRVCFLVAEEARVVGTSLAIMVDERTVYIFGGRVDPTIKGGGIGSLTLAASLKWAESRNAERIWMTYHSGQEIPAKMARRLGFSPIFELPLIRVQSPDAVLEFAGVLKQEEISHQHRHQEVTVQELQALAVPLSPLQLQALCPEGIVVTDSWILATLNALHLRNPTARVFVDLNLSNNTPLSFSVANVGSNSRLGSCLSIYLSPGCNIRQHLESHAFHTWDDIECYCAGGPSLRERHPSLFSHNVTFYSGANVVVAEKRIATRANL